MLLIRTVPSVKVAAAINANKAFTASDLAALRAMTVESTSLAVLEHVRMM